MTDSNVDCPITTLTGIGRNFDSSRLGIDVTNDSTQLDSITKEDKFDTIQSLDE